MKSHKYYLAIFGYFVATMATAYPWHILLFHDKYVAIGAMTRIDPIMPFGMLAVLIQGAVFSYFSPLFYKHKNGGNPQLRGIQFCLFLGLNVWTVMVLATAAKFKIEPVLDFILLGTIFQIIQFVAVGLVIGTIYGNSPLDAEISIDS